MARHRYLDRAPIVEAIFDIRATPPPNFEPASLSALAGRVRDRYPVVEERRAFQALLNLDPAQPARVGTRDLGLDGVVAKSAAELTLVQFRRNGFTLNRLRPYTSWDALLPEVDRLWRMYVEGVQPQRVSRIAARFINRLSLPVPLDDFGRYLTAPPRVPDAMPNAVSAFLTRITLVDPERGLSAHVVQALEPGTGEAAVNLLLDIDAFAERSRGFAPGEIGATFQQLRQFKNDIFFGSITETTAEMYQ